MSPRARGLFYTFYMLLEWIFYLPPWICHCSHASKAYLTYMWGCVSENESKNAEVALLFSLSGVPVSQISLDTISRSTPIYSHIMHALMSSHCKHFWQPFTLKSSSTLSCRHLAHFTVLKIQRVGQTSDSKFTIDF